MEEVIKKLNDLNLDALLLGNDSNIRYVSGYTGSDSYILLLEDIQFFITDYRYSEQAEKECPGYEVVVVDRNTQTHEKVIADIIKSYQILKIAFETNLAVYKFIINIQKELSDEQMIPTEGIVENFRSTKKPEEIENISKAATIADKSFQEILSFIKPGVTEIELAWQLENLLRQNGAQGSAFPIISITGQKTSMPHGIPSNDKIKTGDFITMDFGALYNGYRSDMTRTVILGKPNEKQLKVYNIVKESQAAAVNAVKADIPGRDIDKVANDIIKKHQYLEFASKGTGHGLGLDIHEIPFLNGKCKEKLKENNVITIEPGIYVPFWGGVRIEDTVVVKKTGCEILTNSPRELIEL